MNKRALFASSLALLAWTACGGDAPPDAGEPASNPAPAATPPPPPADPAPREPVTVPATVAASSLGARVYTVQVGAFVQAANASRLVARLTEDGLPVWTGVTRDGGRSLERVRVGALTTYADAGRLGRMLSERLGAPVWVAPVEPDTPLPAGIVEATRRTLGA